VSGHSHHVSTASGKLKLGLLIAVLVLVVEVAGGLLSNSLALLSDAGHVFADLLALALSWYAVKQSERPASHNMTFGYHRVGVIVAVVNAVSILAIVGIILYEAIQRFSQQPEINSTMMLVIAVIGLAANIIMAFFLHKEQEGNINIKSAFWHVLGDALASVGVIAGAVIIMLTGLRWIDALVSILISIIILVAAWGIFREALRILLEGVPGEISIEALVRALNEIPGIKDVHDIHVWSISSNLHAMSCHVLVEDISVSACENIRQQIERVSQDKFGIGHITVQAECNGCDKDGLFCKFEANDKHDEDHDHEHV